MTRCERCAWNYPDELVSRMVTGFDNPNVCAICALAIRNAVHGTREKELRGMAEEMRLDAIDWRDEHPQHAPKEAAQ